MLSLERASTKGGRLVLICFTVVLVLGLSETIFLVDDTYITLQYARNLVETGALVWHPGLPVVDGFTSLGHTLLLAFGIWLGADGVAWASIVSISSAVGILWLLQRVTSQMPLAAQVTGLAFVALNASLLFWTNAGLDAVFYALVFFALYCSYVDDIHHHTLRPKTVFFLILLGLIRPEGMGISLALLAYAAIIYLVRRQSSSPVLIPSIIVLLALAAQIAWRMQSYGFPLPNTFYAKASASRLLEVEFGLSYFMDWLTYSYGLLAVFASLVATAITRDPLRLLFVLGQIGVVVLAGGDSHPMERFFLPILPLIALDLAVIASRLMRPAAVLFLLVLSIWFTRMPSGSLVYWTFPNPLTSVANLAKGSWPLGAFKSPLESVVWAGAARQLGTILPEGTQVAANDVGALAYFSGLPIQDALGLNHQEIAHLPKPEGVRNEWGIYRLDVLLKNNPPVIYISFPQFHDWTYAEVVEGDASCDGRQKRRLLEFTEEFKAELSGAYQCVSVPSGKVDGRWQNFLISKARKDLLQTLPNGSQVSDCLVPLFRQCSTK